MPANQWRSTLPRAAPWVGQPPQSAPCEYMMKEVECQGIWSLWLIVWAFNGKSVLHLSLLRKHGGEIFGKLRFRTMKISGKPGFWRKKILGERRKCSNFVPKINLFASMKRVFRRKIYGKMLTWKSESSGRTALLIEGARRVGKSTIVEEFAKNEYKSYILIDFNRASKDVKSIILYFFIHRLLFLSTDYHVLSYICKYQIYFDYSRCDNSLCIMVLFKLQS